MLSQSAGRCIEGERERKLDMHSAEVCAFVNALRYSRNHKERKKQKRWLSLPPMATVIAHHDNLTGREVALIVRNDTLHTPRGHIEKFLTFSCC